MDLKKLHIAILEAYVQMCLNGTCTCITVEEHQKMLDKNVTKLAELLKEK